MTYRRLFIGLMAVVWVSATVVAVASWAPLRAVAGLPLVLALPGLLLSYAAIPPDPKVDWRLRGVLSVALSISLTLIVGLALGLAFDKVSQGAIALGLGVLGTAAAVTAIVRTTGDAWFEPPQVPYLSARSTVVSGLLLAACATLTVMALSVDSLPGSFTSLTISRNAAGGRLTVENHQGESARYRYAVRSAGHLIRSGRVGVGDGATRSILFAIPPRAQRVRADIYRGSSEPLRSVSLELRHPSPLSPAAP